MNNLPKKLENKIVKNNSSSNRITKNNQKMKILKSSFGNDNKTNFGKNTLFFKKELFSLEFQEKLRKEKEKNSSRVFYITKKY